MLQHYARGFRAIMIAAALALPAAALAQAPQPGAKPAAGGNTPPVTAPTKDVPNKPASSEKIQPT